MSSTEIGRPNDSGEYSVSLPCTTDQFKDFIGNILGESDEINFSFDDPLIIDENAVKNIIEGIQHRIASQNPGIIAR